MAHRVWQDAEPVFVPASVVTKPARHAALKERFKHLKYIYFFALPEYAVRNQERKGRWEGVYRIGLGVLTLRCLGESSKQILPIPSRTQCHQKMGLEDKETRRGSLVYEIWLQGLNKIEL